MNAAYLLRRLLEIHVDVNMQALYNAGAPSINAVAVCGMRSVVAHVLMTALARRGNLTIAGSHQRRPRRPG